MPWLEKIFEFYVKASIHVAFAVLAFLYLSLKFLNIPLSENLVLFVFFITIPSYNLIKHLVNGKKKFFGLYAIDRKILFLSFISLILALYFGLNLSIPAWTGIVCLGLLTAFYGLPVFPKGKNLRYSGTIKILVIGIVWAGTTVVLPSLESGHNLSRDVWVEFIQRVLIVLILMVPFEIRDLGVDSLEMQTIPQRLGIVRTRILGLLVCGVCFSLTFLKDDPTEMELLFKGGISASLVVLLLFLPKRQTRFFASFWVEAFPIFWAIVIWGVIKWI